MPFRSAVRRGGLGVGIQLFKMEQNRTSVRDTHTLFDGGIEEGYRKPLLTWIGAVLVYYGLFYRSLRSVVYGPFYRSLWPVAIVVCCFFCFAVSADDFIGPQATKVLQRLSEMQADNIQRPYSVIMCSLRQRIALALAKAVHMCFCYSRCKAAFHTRTLPQQPPSSDPTPEFRLMHG